MKKSICPKKSHAITYLPVLWPAFLSYKWPHSISAEVQGIESSIRNLTRFLCLRIKSNMYSHIRYYNSNTTEATIMKYMFINYMMKENNIDEEIEYSKI